MKERRRRIHSIYICLLLASCARHSASIEIADAWAPVTPPNATVGAVYMRITAHESDVLVRASTTAAQSVEMHRSSVEDGVARMRRIDSLPFQQHETVAFEPGGTHFMLIGLSAPLADRQQLSFELEFKNAGKIAVNVPVMARGDDHAHH